MATTGADDGQQIGISASDEKLLREKGYHFVRQLGEGSYAKVYLATQKKVDKEVTLACKVINTKKATREFVTKFLPRELDILGKVLHPNIVHVHAIYNRNSKFLIFMRFAEMGDLLEYILEKGELGENICKVWGYQLSLALEYLHTMNVAHRDIKCENILITNNFNVKLADFGFARFVVDYNGKLVPSTTYCGSLAYASPEILKGKPYYPKCSDIWSFGIVLYIMLNKCMPFNDTHIKIMFKQQMNKQWKFRTKLMPTLSQQVVAFVGRLLEPDYRKRVVISDVVKDPWFLDYGLEMTEEEKNALEAATKIQYPRTKLTMDKSAVESARLEDRAPFSSLTKQVTAADTFKNSQSPTVATAPAIKSNDFDPETPIIPREDKESTLKTSEMITEEHTREIVET